MPKIYVWNKGKLQLTSWDLTEVEDEVMHCFNFLYEHYQRLPLPGPESICPGTAYEFLRDVDIEVVLGDTWIGMFTVAEPWHYKGKILSEEVFGPAYDDPMDLEDFARGMEALAKRLGCSWVEFGNRATKKPLTMGRMFQPMGYRVSTVVMQKEIL